MLKSALLGQSFALVFTDVSPGPTTIVARAQFVEQTAKTGPSPGAGETAGELLAGGAEMKLISPKEVLFVYFLFYLG